MEFSAFAKAMNDCMKSCEVCCACCTGSPKHIECQKMTRMVIEMCRACITSCSWGSPWSKELLEMCAKICDACAKECGKHSEAHCKNCAEDCKKAAEACRQYGKSGRATSSPMPFVNA